MIRMGFTCLRDIAQVTRHPLRPRPEPRRPDRPARGGVRLGLRPAGRRSAIPPPDHRRGLAPLPGVAGQLRGGGLCAGLQAQRTLRPGGPVPGGCSRPSRSSRAARSTGSPPPAAERRPAGVPAVGRAHSRFQRVTTGCSRSHPSSLSRPGPGRRSRPTVGSRPIHRAASTRRTWEWATQATSPSTARTRSMTRSTRPPTSAAVSPPGAPSSKRSQPGPLLPDLGRGEALVGAVVPLGQVRVDRRPRPPARPARRSPGPVGAGWSGPAANS